MNSNSVVPVGRSTSWQAVIGLEVHAQILSQTKLFSQAPGFVFGQEPNSSVSFVDVAFPGMLPVLNETCIHQAIRLGLAVKGKVCLHSVFERKHYFYPDNPAGYQISQYRFPLIEGGCIPITDSSGKKKEIRLQRIHVEQDAGKSLHDQDPHCSYVDFNRAGVGLMEIVSHADLSSPEEVVEYVKQLRRVLRALGVCGADMEKGQLRVDANISVHQIGEPWGIRVELKNMNSFRFLQQAIRYEIHRQILALEHGETLRQETRGFHVDQGVTYTMREKETDTDYFYFPDPDLPALVLTQDQVDAIAFALPEVPWDKRDRFIREYGLSLGDAEILSEDVETADFFQQTIAHLPSVSLCPRVAHWMVGDLFALLNRHDQSLGQCQIKPQSLAKLILCMEDKKVSGSLAKEVLAEMFQSGQDPMAIIEERGWTQVSDLDPILAWIRTVLKREESQVEQYLAGKEKILTYLVGQVMKESKGKSNPGLVQTLLRQELASHAKDSAGGL